MSLVRRIVAASCALQLLLPAVSWSGAPPPVVAPRAILVQPDGTVLYWKSGASVALQGSIAKLMTAFVVYWAVDKGYVKWNDSVALSTRATQQACSCMKFTQTWTPTPSGCQPSLTSATKPNEVFRLEDLLQVTLNQSTGESCDAIAEYVARKVYNRPVAKTPADSNQLMNYFVGLMNLRAKELGLKNSRWVTVHGGDGCDFAQGCDPDCTPQKCNLKKCSQGQKCGGGTTVQDLTTVWRALAKRPTFLPLIGTRAFNLSQADPAKTYYNSYVHAYNYYPGLDGDKNGGSGECPNVSGPSASCHMAQASRAGRALIGAALQSFTGTSGTAQGQGAQDVTALFRWAYTSVLAPARVMDTTLAMPVQDHALACRSGMCASAVRTSGDALAVVLWGPGPPLLPWSTPLQQLSTFAPASGPGYFGPLTALDVAFNEIGVIVAGVVVGGQVQLGAWWLESTPTPSKVKLGFRGDSGAQAGAGTLVRTVWLSDELLLTAVREAGGAVRLSTWKVSLGGAPGMSPFQLLTTATAATPNLGASGELVVAAAQQPGIFFFPPPPAFQVVTATTTPPGAAALQAWTVDGTSGAIAAVGTTALGPASNLAIANNGRGKFAVSMTASGASAPATVQVWDVAWSGVFTQTMNWTEPTASAATVIAPLGPAAPLSYAVAPQTLNPQTNASVGVPPCSGGTFGSPTIPASQISSVAFLLATLGPAGAQLSAWDSPAYYQEAPGPLTDFRLADSGSAWGAASAIRLARYTTMDDQQGEQYVTAHQRPDGQLALILWRIGTPIPPPPQN